MTKFPPFPEVDYHKIDESRKDFTIKITQKTKKLEQKEKTEVEIKPRRLR